MSFQIISDDGKHKHLDAEGSGQYCRESTEHCLDGSCNAPETHSNTDEQHAEDSKQQPFGERLIRVTHQSAPPARARLVVALGSSTARDV
jgi:hypothetical protein